MPEYLKGATVTVTLKNGKTYEYKSEEMAVVKRSSMGKTLFLEQSMATITRKLKRKEIVENKKNRIYGLIGSGPTGGMNVNTDGSRYSVTHDKGTVTGIGFQRKVTEEVNVGIQVQSNDVTSLSVGFDF
jgi:hypothetical protein